MTTINENYGPHKLCGADKDIPSSDQPVFATNQGWCCFNSSRHNRAELLVCRRDLLQRLIDAGYDRFGRPLEGNPYGPLIKPNAYRPEFKTEDIEAVQSRLGDEVQPLQETPQTTQEDVQEPQLVDGPNVDDKPTSESSSVEEHVDESEKQAEVGKQAETEAVEEIVETAKPSGYTKSDLKKLSAPEISVLGDKYDCNEGSKSRTIEAILKLQG